jgi:hypothetical protein
MLHKIPDHFIYVHIIIITYCTKYIQDIKAETQKNNYQGDIIQSILTGTHTKPTQGVNVMAHKLTFHECTVFLLTLYMFCI